jgi:hypothetical protein
MTRYHVPLGVLLVALLGLMAADAPQGEFKELFNGKDLSGWDGDKQFWSVEDGAIVGRTTAEKPAKHNTFLTYREAGVGDFELHVSYKIDGGNSGIQYRSKDMGDYVIGGYQADIVAGDPDKYSGILYEEKGRGILAERGQKVHINGDGSKQTVGSLGDAAELAKGIKKDDWNEYVIVAKGSHLVHKINGTTTIDVVDEDAGKAAREGHLALQIHVGPPMTVQFKDIRIKEFRREN